MTENLGYLIWNLFMLALADMTYSRIGQKRLVGCLLDSVF